MYQCPSCKHNFSRQQRLDSHLTRKTPCNTSIENSEKVPKIVISNLNPQSNTQTILCQDCNKTFTSRDSLVRHQKLYCNQMKIIEKTENNVELKHQIDELKEQSERQIAELKKQSDKQIAELRIQVDKLKENPRVSNQILQVVCISNNDNYLDMLTEQWGFDRALEYIKDCALSNLTGDCKLIEKIYLDSQKTNENEFCYNLRYIDKNRTRIEYFDENKKKVVDNKVQFGKRIANNLQNSYLKGVNHLINQNLENHRCPNKFLEDYDLQTWNQHIFNLSDTTYQKKIITNLNIPH